jgi:two-component system chemotaxis response regulator CheB
LRVCVQPLGLRAVADGPLTCFRLTRQYMKFARDIIVIGGSAGAARAVAKLLRQLPGDLPARIFVALHLSPLSREWLSAQLARSSSLQVESPTDEQTTRLGHVYVARPDQHLIVKEDRVLSVRGPRENLWRPAIDVLFRTAAVAYATRVIGVLMTGQLDDGTAGLQAIKTCGGLALVQEPEEAEFPAMPRIAITNVEIDYRARQPELTELLSGLVTEAAPAPAPVPIDLRREAALAESPDNSAEITESVGAPSTLSCVECGGPLLAQGPDGKRMRCLVGHSFEFDTLLQGVESGIDQTLWAAVRMFEQRVNITRMMAERERAQGRDKRAALYEERAQESREHAERLRELHRRRAMA